MKLVTEEVKKLDNFKRVLVPDVVDMCLDPELEFTPVALGSFLKSLKIPASYWKEATEDLQTRMLKEASAVRKEDYLRVSNSETGDDIIGVGPDLPPEVTLTSVLGGFKGELVDCKGSLIEGGTSYLFFKVTEMDKDLDKGRGLDCGYSVLIPSMLSKNMPIRPGIMRVICTNGLIDIEKTGNEFNVTTKDLGKEYLTMISDSIYGVAKDASEDYIALYKKTREIPVENTRILLDEHLESKMISKTIYLKSLKIADSLDGREDINDPAHPRSVNNVWEYCQLLSYVAGRASNPSARVSAEISTMNVLKKLAA